VKSRPGVFGHTIHPVQRLYRGIAPLPAELEPGTGLTSFTGFRDFRCRHGWPCACLFEAGDPRPTGAGALCRLREVQPVAAGSRWAQGDRHNGLARRNVAAGLHQVSCARDDELESVHGEAIVAETRVNPDANARHLELDPAPTRRRAAASSQRAAMGTGRIRSIPNCAR